jgi:4'-phosphopantetheinyl transferase EntD
LQDAAPDVPWSRLLFAAKEAVYKAWFPRTRRWLDFDDVEVNFAPQSGQFLATLPGLPISEESSLSQVAGQWTRISGFVLAAVVISSGRGARSMSKAGDNPEAPLGAGDFAR